MTSDSTNRGLPGWTGRYPTITRERPPGAQAYSRMTCASSACSVVFPGAGRGMLGLQDHLPTRKASFCISTPGSGGDLVCASVPPAVTTRKPVHAANLQRLTLRFMMLTLPNSLQLTVIFCTQVLVFPALSVAVQVIVVTPPGYGWLSFLPSLRTPTIVSTPESASVAVAVPGSTVAVVFPGSRRTV